MLNFLHIPLIYITVVYLLNPIICTSSNAFDCMRKYNLTDELSTGEFTNRLEDCIYYYLADRAKTELGDSRFLHLEEPPSKDDVFNITVDYVTIRLVELAQAPSSQFSIYGDIYVQWNDERLKWDEKEWQLNEFTLHDNHHIWTPTITDEIYTSQCTATQGCYSMVDEIDIFSNGKVAASYRFRYPAFCSINYRGYPEEENECCLLFSANEFGHSVHFILKAESRASMSEAVKLKKADRSLSGLGDEYSVWMIEQRTVSVAKMGGSNMHLLHVCVQAKKQMATLRIALRLPVTIVTMLMLAAPLFGDLRTQMFVKLFTLTLQTVCFLFLCSIAPETGFGKTKPKIYTFYETVVILTIVSAMVTLAAMALSRVSRTVPPPHNVYLAAKVVNRLICCIEPDSSVSYHRHFDESSEHTFGGTGGGGGQTDHTTEWRHIYIAANNLFSAIAWPIFVFVAVFEFL